ncbi:putative N6-adenine methyltransferase-domain-containing protein [Fusarium oxysporum Fo47]|nr:putative N6-adenine methyltransferase-domain-containing protein [Fusarium oxysporum Fo47]KAH7212365.1 putative N6-adenine methyltransferase-domain-containing protein [Fusarium oxysporum]QKD49588.2 putative N6-adenine methyltransferase-domain-containing protein [Fusarium oxysporum Fo47]
MASPLFAARAARKAAFNVAGKRYLSDISITRTGKPIMRVEGGRKPGHTVTVFGATGQLGRYIVNRLARQGCTVVIPYREEMSKRHLKVTGDLGRVVFIEHDLRNTPSIEASVRHSDAVFNLIGRDYPTKNFSLEDVHVEGTERIVEAVCKYDVDRYIHVSSHSANSQSVSEFYRTKGRAEEVARQLFPETTIVRPAPIFGFEDNLLLKLAGVTNLFTSNNMQEKFYPVHSIDVGAALEKIFYDDTTAGQTFELYGPKKYSMEEISVMVDKEIYKQRRHINVPKAILKPVAEILNKFLWWHTLSADEVEREYLDQVIDPEAKTFKDLGIEPGDIINFTYHYLQGFRSQNFYDLPPATEKEKREEKKYIHVLDELPSRKQCSKEDPAKTLTQNLLSHRIEAPSLRNRPYIKTEKIRFDDNIPMSFDDEEPISLSSHALAALAEFHAEKDAHEKTFEKLRTGAAPRAGAGLGVVEPEDEDPVAEDADDQPLSMAAFTEDWNESQFWFLDETAFALADQLLDGASSSSIIGVVSTPSVFIALKNRLRFWPIEDRPKLVLLEHDHRFSVFPEFVFYDFQRPLQLPAHLKGSLDSVIIDPPFFSNDCQTKFALTGRWLVKPKSPRVIVCTGERMATIVDKLYRSLGVYATTFEPAHAGLSNHYYCYANFESSTWDWRSDESD